MQLCVFRLKETGWLIKCVTFDITLVLAFILSSTTCCHGFSCLGDSSSIFLSVFFGGEDSSIAD